VTETSPAGGTATAPSRSRQQRKADVLALLAKGRHLWIATAGPAGPHLVPLLYAWDGRQLVMATHSGHRTAVNLSGKGCARVALGTATDVVLIDGEVSLVTPDAVPGDKAEFLLSRLPVGAGVSDRRYLFLIPTRILAWRHRGELAERTVMARGEWLA
jgi:Pyridoxamine 5'-phosphate oxidase